MATKFIKPVRNEKKNGRAYTYTDTKISTTKYLVVSVSPRVGLALGLAPKTGLRSMTIGIFTFDRRTIAGSVQAIPRDYRAFKGTTNRFRRTANLDSLAIDVKYLLSYNAFLHWLFLFKIS